MTVKQVSKLAQRIQLEATGYYCGYTFKGQPTGRKYIAAAAKSLDYLTTGLEDKTEGQKLHRATHRLMIDMQHRCMTRPAAEEWNLATYWHDQDMTSADYLRTYMNVSFPGGQLVRRLDDEMRRTSERVVLKVMPVVSKGTGKDDDDDDVVVKHFTDLYGYRGSLVHNEPVFYLNPWGFLMLWEIVRLPPPSKSKGEL